MKLEVFIFWLLKFFPYSIYFLPWLNLLRFNLLLHLTHLIARPKFQLSNTIINGVLFKVLVWS